MTIITHQPIKQENKTKTTEKISFRELNTDPLHWKMFILGEDSIVQLDVVSARNE